jgi:hypothetical protein
MSRGDLAGHPAGRGSRDPLRAVWEFNNVDLPYTLTAGRPAGSTSLLRWPAAAEHFRSV